METKNKINRDGIFDEEDTFDADIDEEGSPSQLLAKRMQNHPDRKIFRMSTPKLEEMRPSMSKMTNEKKTECVVSFLEIKTARKQNTFAIAAVLRRVIGDLPKESVWHDCTADCEALSRALWTGLVTLRFPADTITYSTIQLLASGDLIYEFVEESY